MNDFKQEILTDIDWRIYQMATAITLPFRYSIADTDKKFLIRYMTPIIYAVWEGFVKNSFEIYVRELNGLKLKRNRFCNNIISHTLEMNFPQFKEPPNNYPKLTKFFKTLTDYFQKEDFRISPKLPTASNVNLKAINDILLRFNLTTLPDIKYKDRLNKLLEFRNKIAHGDNNISVKISDISEFNSTVSELMHEIFLRIDEGYRDKTYLTE